MASTQSVTTVTGYTAQHMQEIVDGVVVSGHVTNGRLILTTTDGTQIDAGAVIGPQGPRGSDGAAFVVCTSTTRPPGLTTSDEGIAIYETDTNIWRIWTGSFWKPQERIICTSATRPGGLSASHEGTKIYETDTNLEYTWNGSRWVIQNYVVCTSTTRPTGLTTGDEGVQIHEVDTNQNYWWAGAKWRYPLRVICASTTRPTGLDVYDEGLEIYEVDTNKEYVWTGSTWASKQIGVMRVLFENLRTSNSPAIGTSEYEITAYLQTITAVAGKKYYVRWGCRCQATGNNAYFMVSVWNGKVNVGPKLNHAELRLENSSYAEWVEAYMPIILSPGNHDIRFSARVTVAGPTITMTGDPAYPGLYQVLECD